MQIFNFKLKGKFRGYVHSKNLLGTDQQVDLILSIHQGLNIK